MKPQDLAGILGYELCQDGEPASDVLASDGGQKKYGPNSMINPKWQLQTRVAARSGIACVAFDLFR
eukprot:scaffold26427_cov14-Prasinocladus_malaysianus.AAC.1